MSIFSNGCLSEGGRQTPNAWQFQEEPWTWFDFRGTTGLDKPWSDGRVMA
jgi:hypothetical protein